MNVIDEERTSSQADPAALPVGSLVELTFRDGRTVQGTVGFTQGATWAECSDGATVLLSSPWGGTDLENITAARVLRDAQQIHAERTERRFGPEAYPPPTTRDGYEQTLYDLAADIAELTSQTRRMDFPKGIYLRKLQLDAQFDRLADRITLAKTKRRYIFCTGPRRRRGEPMPRPIEISEGPMEEALYRVPKPQDFDPDPATRNRRWPRPALDYNTRAELQSSLDGALRKLAQKRISTKKRRQMEGIAAKRRRQLEHGEYVEAVSAAPIHPAATTTATAAAAPIQTTRATATAARAQQMELF